MSLKAIETAYKGYLFRSRLEARWAVFLDALTIPYHYEPEGFDLDGLYYLPDFRLPVQKCWLEIKPKINAWYRWDQDKHVYLPAEDARAPESPESVYVDLTKARRLSIASGFPVFMLFDDLCPLGFLREPDSESMPDMGAIVGSNKAWHSDGKHDDGCVEWGQCPHCGLLGLGHVGQHDLCSCQCTERKTTFANIFVRGGPRRSEYCAFCGINMGPGSLERMPHRWMNSGSDAILAAYQRARSARFEFGRSGN